MTLGQVQRINRMFAETVVLEFLFKIYHLKIISSNFKDD